jgi:predicted nucleotidyltransferase
MGLVELGSIVEKWASSQPLVTRAILYGSRVKGTHRPDSDLDVAIELTPLPGDGSTLATWFGEESRLTASLAPLLPVPLDLEWYGDAELTPTIHRGLEAGSVVVFTRAPLTAPRSSKPTD